MSESNRPNAAQRELQPRVPNGAPESHLPEFFSHFNFAEHTQMPNFDISGKLKTAFSYTGIPTLYRGAKAAVNFNPKEFSNECLFGPMPPKLSLLQAKLEKIKGENHLPKSELEALQNDLKEVLPQIEQFYQKQSQPVPTDTPLHKLLEEVGHALTQNPIEMDDPMMGEVPSSNPDYAFASKQIPSATEQVEKLLKEHQGWVQQGTDFFTSYIEQQMKEAFSGFHSLQSALRKIIGSAHPTRDEVRTTLRWIEMVSAPEHKNAILGVEEKEALTPQHERIYREFLARLDDVKAPLQTMLEQVSITTSPELEEKLNALDMHLLGCIKTQEGKFRNYATSLFEKLNNPREGALSQFSQQASNQMSKAVTQQLSRPPKSALDLYHSFKLLDHPQLTVDMVLAVYQDLCEFWEDSPHVAIANLLNPLSQELRQIVAKASRRHQLQNAAAEFARSPTVKSAKTFYDLANDFCRYPDSFMDRDSALYQRFFSSLSQMTNLVFPRKLEGSLDTLEVVVPDGFSALQQELAELLASDFARFDLDRKKAALARSALKEECIDRETGALSSAMDQLTAEAPEQLTSVYQHISALLGQSPSREDVKKALLSLREAIKSPDYYFKTKLRTTELRNFTTLADQLSSITENGDRHPNLDPIKEQLRGVMNRLEEHICDQQGQAITVLFKMKKGVFDPETGFIQEMQSQFVKFAESMFARADENLLAIPPALETLIGLSPQKEDLTKAKTLLFDLYKNPVKYIGRDWENKEAHYIKRVLKDLTDEDPALALEAAKPFIKNKVLPQIKKFVTERQGPVHTYIEQIWNACEERATLAIKKQEAELTKQPHEMLDRLHASLTLFRKAIESDSRNEMTTQSVPLFQTLRLLQGQVREVFNPHGAIDVNTQAIGQRVDHALETLENYIPTRQLRFDPTPSQTEALDSLDALHSLVEEHLQKQGGTIYRVMKTVGENFQARMIEQPMKKVMDTITPLTNLLNPAPVESAPQPTEIEDPLFSEGSRMGNPQTTPLRSSSVELPRPSFSSHNLEQSSFGLFASAIRDAATPLLTPGRNQPPAESQPGAQSPLSRMFEGAIGMVTSMGTNFGTAVARQALRWPCDILLDFLQKARGVVEERDGLQEETKLATLSALDTALDLVSSARESGTIESYQTALNRAKEALGRHPILLNGIIELPSFNPPAAPNEQSDLIEVQNNMLRRLDRANNAQAEETRNWSVETDRQKEIFKVNSSFMGAFKYLEWFCGSRDQREIIDQRIQIELEHLLGTPQYAGERDRLRRDYGYFDQRLQDNSFADIMGSIQSITDPEQKRDEFIRLSREYIERRGDISSVTKWFAKFSLPLVHRIVHFLVDRFSDGLVDFIREEIRETQLRPLKPVNAEPIVRTTAWFQTYRDLLRAYADNRANSLDRGSFLRILMNDPTFNHGYEGNEIYSEFSKLAVDQLLPAMNWTSVIATLSGTIGDWKSQNVVDPESGSGSGLNYLLVPIKWVAGSAVQTLLFGAKVLIKIPEWFANKGLNFGLKQFLVKTDLVKQVFDSSKFSIYEETPFTYSFDKVLCDQLKQVYTMMRNQPADAGEPGPQFDQVKEELQHFLKGLFKVLETRGMSTPEELRQLFERPNSLMQNLQQGGFNLILDDVIDSISRLIFVGYKSILDSNQMERQAAHSFQLINEAITTGIRPLSEEEQRLRQTECERTKQELQYYRDNILWQSVSQSIDRKINQFGQAKQDAANKIIHTIQEEILGKETREGHLPGFIEKYEQWLRTFDDNFPKHGGSDTQVKRQARIEQLNLMHHEITSLLQDLNNKLLEVQRNGELGVATKQEVEKVIRLMTEKVNAVANDFEILYRMQHSHNTKVESIPAIRAVDAGFQTLIAHAVLGRREGFSPELTGRMRTQLRELVRTGKDELRQVQNPSRELLHYIELIDMSFLENKVNIFEKHARLLQQLDRIESNGTSLIDSLARDRVVQINQRAQRNAMSNLAHAVAGERSAFDVTFQNFSELIADFPEELDRNVLMGYLNRMRNTATSEEVEAIATELHSQVTLLRNRDDELIATTAQEISTLRAQLTASASSITTRADQSDRSVVVQGYGNLLQVKQKLTALKKSASEDVHDILPISVNVINHGRFVDIAKHQIYSELKKRSEHAMEVMRDPIMFEGVMRHNLLFNFVETYGSDRRRVVVPSAYSQPTAAQ